MDTPDNVGLRRWRRLWYWTFGVTFLVTAISLAAGFVFAHHRSTHGLVIALIVVVATYAVTAALTWKWIHRDHVGQQLMQDDWRTRRRVGKALRKGRPIADADRSTARNFIAFQKQRRWLPWLYVGLAVIWLLNTFAAHGTRRWIDLGLAVLYLALAPILLRTRNKMLRRDDELRDA